MHTTEQSRWTVFSQRRDGTLAYAFPVVQNLRYSEVLNAPGACSFRLPNRALPDGRPLKHVLQPGVHEIGVLRGQTLVWLGPLLTVAVEAFNQGMVEFGAEGLAFYLDKMHVEAPLEGATQDYTPNPDDGENPYPPGRLVDTDQFVIMKRLIDHHQNKPGGTFYLDTSTIGTSGVLRTRTYDPTELHNVGEMVENLSRVQNGFDYAVLPDRTVRAYYPARGIRRRGLVLTRFTTPPQRLVDATEQASEVIGIGAGEGKDMLTYTKSDYNAVTDYGLTQAVYANKDVSEIATLREQTDAEHARSVNGATEFSAKVQLSESDRIDVGDEVRLLYSDGYDKVDEYVRVIGKDTEPDNAAVALTFASAREVV